MTRLALLVLAALSLAAAPPARDPLPPGAVARLGRARMVVRGYGPLTLSPDGKLIVCDGQCFDFEAGREVPPPVRVPDGTRLYRLFAGGYVVKGKTFTLFDPKPRAITFANGFDDLDQLDFDARGRYCLHVTMYDTKDRETNIRIADLRRPGPVKEWTTIARLRNPNGWHFVRLSKDGSRVVFWDASNLRLNFYDVETGKTTTIDPEHNDRVRTIAVSDDGKHVACYWPGHAMIFDVKTGRRTHDASLGDFKYAQNSQFAPDGKSVVFFASNEFAAVPLNDNEKPTRHPLREREWPKHFLILNDSRRFAVLSVDVLRLIDVKTGKQADPHSRYPCLDGVRLLDSGRAATWTDTGKLIVWDARDGRVLSESQIENGRDGFHAFRIGRDGKYVVALGEDAERKLLGFVADVKTGKVVRQWPGIGSWSSRHTLDLWNDVAVCCTGDLPARMRELLPEKHRVQPLLHLYDVDPRTRLRTIAPRFAGKPTFSPDGKHVLIVDNYRAELLELSTGKARWTARLPSDSGGGSPEARFTSDDYRTASFDPAGRRIVIVRQHDATVLDVLSGRVLQSVPFPSSPKAAFGLTAAVSGSGRWVAVDARDNSVRMFNLDAKDVADPVVAHVLPNGRVTGLALNADGSRLVTSHTDGTCVVWDVKALIKMKKTPEVDHWKLLASLDPAEARPAIEALSEDGAKAVKLFAEKLPAATTVVKQEAIAAAVKQLDSDDEDVRAAAERRLIEAGDHAEKALRRAAREPISAEQQLRAEALLKKLDPANDGKQLRQLRAVEILEALASKDAVALLERLAKGAPSARLTREAKASLMRLKERDEP